MKHFYKVELVLADDSGYRGEVLDEERLSFAVGKRNLFEVVVETPQGLKRVTISAKVEKYR